VEVAGLGVEEREVRLHRLHLRQRSRGAKHQTVLQLRQKILRL
jgi:hypothetical protein